MKIKEIYVKYFYGIIFVIGISAYMIFLYTNSWNPLVALKALASNLGIGIVGSILSLVVIRTQLEKYFDDINLKNSGIRGYRNGYHDILNALGGTDKFFSLRINKKIDIYGIAMAEFFETNAIVDMLYKKAKENHKIRVFFDDTKSQELRNQELIENKPGELEASIKRNTNALLNKFKSSKKLQSHIEIYHVTSLPRMFILRSGNRMIVTNYLFEGPSQSPSIYLKDDEYLNACNRQNPTSQI